MNIFGFQAGNFFEKLTWFRVIYRWKWIKSLSIEDRATKVVPKVSIFSGKAAPGTPHLVLYSTTFRLLYCQAYYQTCKSCIRSSECRFRHE